MSSRRLTRESARLAAADAVTAALHQAYGPVEYPKPRGSAFEALARTIVYQQLGAAAAGTIWKRFRRACDSKVRHDIVLALPDAHARSAGLSGGKWRAVTALAQAVDDGDLRLRGLGRLDEDAIRTRLLTVRGIGPWTVDMFLMFHLQRLDVWPTGDLGVRKGFARAWGLGALPSPRELDALAEPYRPYRSLLAWYCWRAADAP